MSVRDKCNYCGKVHHHMYEDGLIECRDNLLDYIDTLKTTLRDIRRYTFAVCSEGDGNKLRRWIDVALKST